MQNEILIAGFGGQGVLFAGQLLAYAAMDEGKQVTWIPSYGPEMRGGTANCTVIISDEEIGSPLVSHPQAVIAMNRPSLDKYEPMIKPGGVLIINTSMVDRKAVRKDIKVVEVDANAMSEKLGDKRMSNMVLLGALLGQLKVLPNEAIEKALRAHLPERHHKLLPKNYEALHEGARLQVIEI
ncbi:MAG: 2-oxoacid:acceptor oxidoreductase family protein [Anaerolineaceae bacterium]|jgi:2-oxoglutarate ferredoxin oxidoreductase subunit gamma